MDFALSARVPHPFFSVIIPTRDRPGQLSRALRSVHQQDFRAFELIVINDGSRQSYDAVLKEFGDTMRYESHTEAGGVAAARNRGAALARGEWLVFLDDDDEWLPGFLGGQAELLQQASARVGFAWCNILRQVHDGRGRVVSSYPTGFRPERLELMCSLATCIGAGFGLTVRRTCFEGVGGFDPSLRIGEDTDCILALLANGDEPLINPAIGVIVHEHQRGRLGGNLAEYSDGEVYDRMIAKHRAVLRSHARVRAGFMGWVARVHYSQGKRSAGDRVLRDMLSMNWRCPRTLAEAVRLGLTLRRRCRAAAEGMTCRHMDRAENDGPRQREATNL